MNNLIATSLSFKGQLTYEAGNKRATTPEQDKAVIEHWTDKLTSPEQKANMRVEGNQIHIGDKKIRALTGKTYDVVIITDKKDKIEYEMCNASRPMASEVTDKLYRPLKELCENVIKIVQQTQKSVASPSQKLQAPKVEAPDISAFLG